MAKPAAPEAQSADEAIRRALEEESRAEVAVQRCREQAEAVLAASRERARRIADRADRRIGDVHLHCSHKTARAIDDLLRRSALEGKRHIARIERADLERVVEAVAAELTGEEAGEPGDTA